MIFVSIPFTLLKEKYLDLVLKHGLNVEVALHADALDRYRYKDFREVAKKLKQAQLKTTVHLPFIDLSPGAIDPWIKEVSLKRFSVAMQVAELFEPLNMVFHSGYHSDYYREKQEEWLVSVKDGISYLLKLAEEVGSSLSVENTFEPEPELLMEVLREFEGKLYWCFDPAHARVFSKKHELYWLEKLHPYLKEIHCHDNSGEVDEHLAIGKGVIEFKKIFEFFKTKKLKPILTSEAHTEEDTYLNLKALEHLYQDLKDA